MDTYLRALVLSTLASLLIASIDIVHKSGKSIQSLICQAMVIYVLIIAFGNDATTLLAASFLEGADPDGAIFPGPRWFWYAFIGVFGFTALIQHVNVTLFDKGVLTINEWISKAADNATGAAISRSVDIELREVNRVASKLKNLPESELNAHVLQKLGSDALIGLSQMQDDTDARLLKALTLADADLGQAKAIVSSME